MTPPGPGRAPILIVGATRGTGLLIAQRLQARGFALRALARDPQQAAARLGAAVEVMRGDITRPDSLAAVVQGVRHIVFTAGVRSGRYAPEARVRATDYQGVANVIAAVRQAPFTGRFLYMTSMGASRPSLWAFLLNLLKRNTLAWRARAEADIRSSGLDYTIIRAGFLLNAPAGRRAIRVSQDALPLSPRYHIGRADVADAFVAALEHPRASRATFDIAWARGRRSLDWTELLSRLQPDVRH